MRKLRFAIVPAVVFLMVGASPALGSAPTRDPVLAGYPAKVPHNGGVHLCAALNRNLCLHGNGTYNQMTIETSNLTDVTFTAVPTVGPYDYALTNAAGNCIRENDSDHVNVEASGCDIGDLNEIWTLYQGGTAGYYLKNVAMNNLMVVHSVSAGSKVWGGSTSDDWHWWMCSGGWCQS